jgi:uncharacterized protein YecT (DUF1311 family)
MLTSIARIVLIAVVCGLLPAAGDAQNRKPTPQEVAAIRACAAKYKDNVPEGERQCLFNLVATPCIDLPGGTANLTAADCYRIEGVIWDDLLNQNYQSLLATLNADQAGKARAMQRAWIAYRDTTCQFYDDKIQGSMAVMMHAACATRESARRALLLAFFAGL